MTNPIQKLGLDTIEQSQIARGETQNAASAHAQIAACTVAGFDRM